VTRDEILKKIAQIEQKEDDVNLLVKDMKSEEEGRCQYLIESQRLLEHRYEDCQGDRELLRVLEEEQEVLRNIQNMCNDFVCDLDEVQKQTRRKCELEIDELRSQLQGLEV